MSKGSRRERELVELLKAAGMATYRPATVRFGENDMFGLFDVLALSPSHSRVYAIQVKSNRAVGIEKWGRNTQLFRSLGWETYYAVPVDNQGWKLLDPGMEPEDGRKSAAVLLDESELDGSMGEGVTEYFDRIAE
jgi:Holliday junction resolvase